MHSKPEPFLLPDAFGEDDDEPDDPEDWEHDLDLDEDLEDDDDEDDEDVTSPQVILTAKEYVEDASLLVFHNATWHLYRQPDWNKERQGTFALVHVPSTECQLDNAPPSFVIALLGAEQGVAHTGQYCKDCEAPFWDEHPTLAEEYKRLAGITR